MLKPILPAPFIAGPCLSCKVICSSHFIGVVAATVAAVVSAVVSVVVAVAIAVVVAVVAK